MRVCECVCLCLRECVCVSVFSVVAACFVAFYRFALNFNEFSLSTRTTTHTQTHTRSATDKCGTDPYLRLPLPLLLLSLFFWGQHPIHSTCLFFFHSTPPRLHAVAITRQQQQQLFPYAVATTATIPFTHSYE